jgi:hypothetical protein
MDARVAVALLLAALPLAGSLVGASAPTALDAARNAVVEGAWEEALAATEDAGRQLAGVPRPPAAPGSMLDARLGEAREAVLAREASDALEALALARAGVVHAALEVARQGSGAPNLTLLGEAIDLGRSPGLQGLFGALAQDPANATLRHRALQRLLDRVAEAARVETVLAEVAAAAGLPQEARLHGLAARELARVLEPEAARLPAVARADYGAQLGAWDQATADASHAGLRDAGAKVRPVLLALGLGRTIVRLDDLGDALLLHALAAEEAERRRVEAPTFNATRLAEAAVEHLSQAYRAVRGELFLLGEGTLDGLDAAVAALQEALGERAPAASLRGAVEGVRAELQRVAHLTFGAFAKVEYVNVPRNRTTNFTLQAGRFPLEGVRDWAAEVRFDPRVALVEGASSRHGPLEAVWDNATGRLALRAAFDPPLQGSGFLANLVFRGVGPPGAQTDLALQRFDLSGADGLDAEMFLLRHGNLTVALYDPDQVAGVVPEEGPLRPTNPALEPRQVPGPSVPLLLALLGGAAGARRRGSARER